MKLLMFFAAIVLAFVAVSAAPVEEQATCSPWLSYCQVTEQCCRHLICSTYQAKCVPKDGLVIPGQDTRPVGPGPYPPNFPTNELP